MNHRILLLSCSLLLTLSTIGQDKLDCFEIKHLDFFGIENKEELKWPASELDKLLLEDYVKAAPRKTNFLIPLLIFQLKNYYPACPTQSDTSSYRKLTQLYAKIRQQDFATLTAQSKSAQLEFIRQDFYEQILNDSLLPFMSFTVDDGPFYGQLSKYIPNYKKGQSKKTEFGTVFITKDSGKEFITVVNNEGKHLWTRIITRESNYSLKDISFPEKEIEKTSLGYHLLMFSGGEALNFYLKSNGELRYYFHSW